MSERLTAEFREALIGNVMQLHTSSSVWTGHEKSPLVHRSEVIQAIDAAFGWLEAAVPTPQRAEPPGLREAAQEVLSAFYISPGITTGRQAKAIDALRAALATPDAGGAELGRQLLAALENDA